MDIGIGLGEEAGPSCSRDQKSEEEYNFEVLSTDQIVQHMVESIKEVNSVIQVSADQSIV
jgi:ariadne-1